MTKKLSQRERMLIRHAIKRYEKATDFKIYIGDPPKLFWNVSLWTLRVFNRVAGRPDELAVYYGEGSQIRLDL